MKIGLIGDYDENVTAHKAIPIAINLAAGKSDKTYDYQWIHTNDMTIDVLESLSGIWCVPASPYSNMENAIDAITYARTNNIPYLGTCGGYQHAALEFAGNVLNFPQADNAEVNPNTEMPLISALACQLVEVSDEVWLTEGSMIEKIYGKKSVHEEYRCGFGINCEYLKLFEGSEMKFSGFDREGDPRVLELPGHRFFIGTAFQPERSALQGKIHPNNQPFFGSNR